MMPIRFARLRRACDRLLLMMPIRFARLRRACDRLLLMMPIRFARLRRACDRHAGKGLPTIWRGRARARCGWSISTTPNSVASTTR
jgi:hypothetical protein